MKVVIKGKNGLSVEKAKEMLRDGTANGHKLTSKQKRYFGYVAGGGAPKAEDGTTLLDTNTIQFNGPSHSEGGIPISYSGHDVEVEGGETGYFSPEDDSLHIMGNMTNPLTNRKFKTDSKIIADNEAMTIKRIAQGTELVNNSNPEDKWGILKFNSGTAMMRGGSAKMKQLQQSKEHLATIQRAMLDTADELGADPQEFSKGKLKKAAYGDKIPYSRLRRNEGSLRLPYDMYTGQTTPLDPVSVQSAPRFKGQNDQISAITPKGIQPGTPPSSLTRTSPSYSVDQNSVTSVDPNDPSSVSPTIGKKSVMSNAKGLGFDQILPELYTAATNKVEPVFLQQYTPELYSPYRVNFQNRRNQNQSTFRAISQKLLDNPEALSTLAGQKYQADQQVNSDEFQVNQEISNGITNKNIGLINDAKLKNLSLADTQYTRQAEAKAKTKTQNRVVLQSIADKVHANELEQQTLKLYENLYDYRFDPRTGQKQYTGAPVADYLDFRENGSVPGTLNSNDEKKVVVRRDANNKVVSSTETTNPQSLTESRMMGNQSKAWQLYKNKFSRLPALAIPNAGTQKYFKSYTPYGK